MRNTGKPILQLWIFVMLPIGEPVMIKDVTQDDDLTNLEDETRDRSKILCQRRRCKYYQRKSAIS
nr:hypothetical protein [Lebetimonas sp. JH292]